MASALGLPALCSCVPCTADSRWPTSVPRQSAVERIILIEQRLLFGAGGFSFGHGRPSQKFFVFACARAAVSIEQAPPLSKETTRRYGETVYALHLEAFAYHGAARKRERATIPNDGDPLHLPQVTHARKCGPPWRGSQLRRRRGHQRHAHRRGKAVHVEINGQWHR